MSPGNYCSLCRSDFGSVTAFERHRVGPFDGERRCLTDEEKIARGYERTAHGRWTLGKHLHRGRAFQGVSANPSASPGEER